MSVLWDIIGAMLIGGVLMFTTNRAIENGAREFVNHNADVIVQSELTTITQIIQSDLRKVGYGIAEAYQASIIQTIASDRFEFLTRVNMASPTADTVEYVVQLCDSIVYIDAVIRFYAIDRIVRQFGEEPMTTRIGTITNKSVFRYLDQVGRETAIRQSVKMVEVTLIAQNPQIYSSNELLNAATPTQRKEELMKLSRESYWRQTRVVSRNLRR